MSAIDLSVDFSGVTPMAGDGPLPAGEYVCRIAAAAPTRSQGGTPGIECQMEVAAGEFSGRKLWDTIWLTPKALGMALAKLQAVGYPIPEGRFQIEPQRLVGRKLEAVVRIETYEGRERAKVKGWNEVAGANPADPLSSGLPAAAPAAPPAGGEDSDIPFAASRA